VENQQKEISTEEKLDTISRHEKGEQIDITLNANKLKQGVFVQQDYHSTSERTVSKITDVSYIYMAAAVNIMYKNIYV
jgi:D-alanyl-D-alanine dipeptidase